MCSLERPRQGPHDDDVRERGEPRRAREQTKHANSISLSSFVPRTNWIGRQGKSNRLLAFFVCVCCIRYVLCICACVFGSRVHTDAAVRPQAAWRSTTHRRDDSWHQPALLSSQQTMPLLVWSAIALRFHESFQPIVTWMCIHAHIVS